MTAGRDTPPAPGDLPGDAGFLACVLDIARRRLPLIAATSGCFLALAGVWIVHQPFVYRAEAIIDLAPRSAQVVKLDEFVERFNPSEGAIGTELSYLRSRAFLERVLTRLRDENPTVYLRLHADRDAAPSFARLFYDGPVVAYAQRELGGYIAHLQAGERDREAPEAAAGEPGLAAGHDPALLQEVSRRLEIERLERSPVLGIGFSAHDPELAAAVANAAAELYVGGQTTSKEASFDQARAELDREAEGLKAEIGKIEAEIQKLRDRTDFEPKDGPGRLQLEAAAVTQELLAARSQREALAEQLNLLSARREGGPPAAVLVAGLMSTPVLEDLRAADAALARRQAETASEFGPRHPRTIQLEADRERLEQRIQLEVEATIARAQQEIRVLGAREADFGRRLDQLRKSDASERRVQVEIRELERQRDARTRLLEIVLSRQKETQLQASMVQSDARLLSAAAVPAKRESPRLLLLLGLNLMASALLGGGAALVAEQLDRRLRTAVQVEAATDLGVLAWIPQIGRAEGRLAPLSYAQLRPASVYAEAVRNMRRAVQLRLPPEDSRLLGVSSSQPEEGKTTLAQSLAYSFATAGEPTVLVELDLRRPNLQWQMGTGVEAGVEDYLSGLADLDQVVCVSPASDRLAYVPVRRQPGCPADFFESPRLDELLRALAARFARVVVDLPPVLQLADAPTVAGKLDAVLFAVRWNRTDWLTAATAVARLRDARANVLGVVFTRVDLAASRRHGASNPYYDLAAYRAYYRE